MSSTALLQTLFDHKAWADDELLTRLRELNTQPQAADRHTALRILNHIHVVDRLFEAQLQRQPLPFAATNTPETPTLDALRAAVRSTDAWYQQHLQTLDDAALAEPIAFHFSDGAPGRMTRAEMLLHVAVHGSYHRGAAGRLLVQHGIAAPRDVLTGFLHLTQPDRRMHGAARDGLPA